MKFKKFGGNLFSQANALKKNDETGETFEAGDRTLAAWSAGDRHRPRKCAPFWIDASLADRLEQITEEVREMLPTDLQDRFHVSTVAELIFASVVDEYDGRSFKNSSVLAQLISIWISRNENPPPKN